MEKDKLKIAIIGGGAAGFFSALSCAQHHPNYEISIFEKSNKLLSKVKISGGGRCNVTNATFSIAELSKNYPRGGKKLKKVFSQFMTSDTIEWFESRGVKLVTQEDLCIFPKSQNSQTIIDLFLTEAQKLGVKTYLQYGLEKIKPIDNGFLLSFRDKEELIFDKVIITIGGQPKLSGLNLFQELGHQIEFPVPSLFTFNMPDEKVKELMGIVVENAKVRIQSSDFLAEGPLLITHWGMSGPAILKLSAWGARFLHDLNYEFKIQVNWLGLIENKHLNAYISDSILKAGEKKIINAKIVPIPSRLWYFLLDKIGLNLEKKWSEISQKEKNKLLDVLQNDIYQVKGKTTFKEEFVTCGGVNLDKINFESMESKLIKGLYFAGEVMDVDGITGGFNFQAAWSTGFVAGKLK